MYVAGSGDTVIDTWDDVMDEVYVKPPPARMQVAPLWEWIAAMKNSEMADRIRLERLCAKPDTPEAFYWEERCPTHAIIRRPRRSLVKR